MVSGQRKKILFVITKSVWGGAQKYVYDLATNIPRDVFEPVVALAGHGPLAERLRESNVPVYEISSLQRSINPFKDIIACVSLLRLFVRLRPDIVHANSSKAGGLAGIAVFIYNVFHTKKIRLIFTAHGWAFHEVRPRWQQVVIKFASRLTALCADTVITVSEYDRQSALKNRIAPQRKLTTIHIGTRPISCKTRAEAQHTLLASGHPLVIGSIGEWNANMGWDILLAGFEKIQKKFPQAHLVMIGSGENTDKELVYRYIKTHHLSTAVTTHEYIKDAALYLNAFDIFAYPARKAGLPYALLEAGLAELPVIATSVGGIPEIITNGISGLLIQPDSSQELSVALQKVIGDHPQARNFGSSLKRQVQTLFSFKNMVETTLTVYSSLE